MLIPTPDFAPVNFITPAAMPSYLEAQTACYQEMKPIIVERELTYNMSFSTPPTEWLRKFYDLYSFNIIPPLGGLLAGDKASYQYLVESIRKFPRQEAFADMLRDAGFSRVNYEDYTGGVCALHWGWNV